MEFARLFSFFISQRAKENSLEGSFNGEPSAVEKKVDSRVKKYGNSGGKSFSFANKQRGLKWKKIKSCVCTSIRLSENRMEKVLKRSSTFGSILTLNFSPFSTIRHQTAASKPD